MALPTISGRIRMPDDSVYVGPFRMMRRSGPMLNGTTLVGLQLLEISTDTDGDFETELHPGVYELHTLIGGYPGAPAHKVVFRVPNTDDDLNFSDLEFETAMPDPSWFGGDSGGGGGDVDTATTTTQGIVKINVSDADPVAVVKKSLDGTNGLGFLIRPVAGKAYLRNVTSGDYHEIFCDTYGPTVQIGINQVGVAFASLPSA